MLRKFLSPSQIDKQNERLAVEIQAYYDNTHHLSLEQPLQVISILKGSFVFVSDLVRRLSLPLQIHFMEVSSYKGEKVAMGEVEILSDINHDLNGLPILFVEDIIDTGSTLLALLHEIRSRNPLSVEVASLLYKTEKSNFSSKPRFIGFEIQDDFVVGYGMDYRELYRNLPYIAILTE